MIVLDFLENVLMEAITFQGGVIGFSYASIFGCVIVTLFIFSIAVITFLARRKFNNFLRVPIIIFCVFVLFTVSLIILIRIDGYRIQRGAEVFIQDSIVALNSGKLPLISSHPTDKEKRQIEAVVNNLPREDYEIEFSDNFGDLWEFYVHFKNGKAFYVAVDAHGTFMRLFARAEYKLFRFVEEEKIQNQK